MVAKISIPKGLKLLDVRQIMRKKIFNQNEKCDEIVNIDLVTQAPCASGKICPIQRVHDYGPYTPSNEKSTQLPDLLKGRRQLSTGVE